MHIISAHRLEVLCSHEGRILFHNHNCLLHVFRYPIHIGLNDQRAALQPGTPQVKLKLALFVSFRVLNCHCKIGEFYGLKILPVYLAV
jgi:hypothetical protein